MFDTSFATDCMTNDAGILKVQRNKFTWYNTKTDESNTEYEGYAKDIPFRHISLYADTITITLSFTKESITENSYANVYRFRSGKFVLKDKQL